MRCNSQEYHVGEGDLVVVNSNELHQGSTSTAVEYYCIIFDTSIFQSRRVDTLEAKYIGPINQNAILFKNKIENDGDIAVFINEFVKEIQERKVGFELALKAILYKLLVLLLRKHVQIILSPRDYEARINYLNKLNSSLEYIEKHYNEKITIDELCVMAQMSRFHFCRVFKNITGKTMGEYLRILRVNKAEELIRGSSMNITEAAMACGFDDINYFSRVFKMVKKKSPSAIIKERKGY